MEYYSAMKKDETLMHATTRMNLKNIMFWTSFGICLDHRMAQKWFCASSKLRLQEVLQVSAPLLDAHCCHANKPELTCWRMRLSWTSLPPADPEPGSEVTIDTQ